MTKTILITGTSSGLGKLLAEKLASQGHQVYAGMRQEKDIATMSELWQQQSLSITPIMLDVTKDAQVQQAVQKILQIEKRIDVLINNAGVAISGPVLDFKPADLLDLLQTNVVGGLRMIQAVLPVMRKQKGGRIITITSMNGHIALPNFSLYCSSKFAAEGLGQSLAIELAEENILVTNVAPGAMRSPEQQTAAKALPHRSARERFLLLRLLFPITEMVSVAEQISQLIDNPHPPVNKIIGRDTLVTVWLKRFLPNLFWNRLLLYIWSQQH